MCGSCLSSAWLFRLPKEDKELLNTLPMAAHALFGIGHSCLLGAAIKSIMSLPHDKNVERKSWRKSAIHIHQKGENKQEVYTGYLDGGASELLTSNERSRLLIKEMDRVNNYPDELVPSNILHTLPQLFPRHELITGIERELRKNITKEVEQEDLKIHIYRRSQVGKMMKVVVILLTSKWPMRYCLHNLN